MTYDLVNDDLSINTAEVDRRAREDSRDEPARYELPRAGADLCAIVFVPLISMSVVSYVSDKTELAIAIGGALFVGLRMWGAAYAHGKWYARYVARFKEQHDTAGAAAAELRKYL